MVNSQARASVTTQSSVSTSDSLKTVKGMDTEKCGTEMEELTKGNGKMI